MSKIILNVYPDSELLSETNNNTFDEIIKCLKSNQFRAHASLLECLTCIIFHFELEFEHFTDRFIPVLIEMTGHQDWNTKKVAIDAINSLVTTNIV